MPSNPLGGKSGLSLFRREGRELGLTAEIAALGALRDRPARKAHTSAMQ